MGDCNLCNGPLDGAPLVGTTSRHGHASRRVSCLTCGLVQVTPQPTKHELGSYYSSHEYRAEHGPVSLTVSHGGISRLIHPTDDDYSDALDVMGDYRVQWVSKAAGLIPGMRILEVGAGDGRTLKAFANQGMAVYGVEPDEAEVETARELLGEFPQRLQVGTLDDLDTLYAGQKFDAIVMFHVLEHLHDPLQDLRHLSTFLTPRGALAVEVPNLLTPGLPLELQHYQHVHLYDFTEYTLSAMLVHAGFEPVYHTTPGNLRFVARPVASGAAPVEYRVPHGGVYVSGFLDGIKAMEGALVR